MASAPLYFESSEEAILVSAPSAKVQDAPERSSPSFQGGEMVFPRVPSPINSFPCHCCSAAAVEVSTLCLQASFRVSKTCLLDKLKGGISPMLAARLVSPQGTFLD